MERLGVAVVLHEDIQGDEITEKDPCHVFILERSPFLCRFFISYTNGEDLFRQPGAKFLAARSTPISRWSPTAPATRTGTPIRRRGTTWPALGCCRSSI